MAGNAVGWFEIYVNDMARAQAFYETVMGVTLEALGDPTNEALHMRAFPADMEQYGASGALVHMDGFPAGGNSTLVYFSSEDCAVEESRVAAAGGKVERPKMSIGDYGFITLAIDTEGNMFGIHSQQ